VSDLLQIGINFFNDGRYFEAHEAWEDLWRQTRGPLRLFYQGLVQAAVGCHHLTHGNANGARAQLKKSLAKLEQYPALFCGVRNQELVAGLREVLVQMSPDILQKLRIAVTNDHG
jgi:predicted metal-dependent hydrolase